MVGCLTLTASFKSQVKEQLITRLIRNYFEHLRECQEKMHLNQKRSPKDRVKIALPLKETNKIQESDI